MSDATTNCVDRANALLYRNSAGDTVTSSACPEPLTAHLLATPVTPSLRITQTTPISQGRGELCTTCSRPIKRGQGYVRVDVDKWGSPKFGVLLTWAFCGRCIEKGAPVATHKKRKEAAV